MRFDIITIFPKVFRDYFNESIISRAQKKKLAKIKIWDLRNFLPASMRSFGRVDDRPYGGGPGMVLKIEPIARALGSILRISNLQFSISKQNKKSKSKTLIVLFSPAGKQFTQKTAKTFSKKYDRIIMICGRYEGIDERVKSVIENWKPARPAGGLKIGNLSIGPYVLTGGELPAMVIVDAVLRKIPGVLGKSESLEEKRHGIGVPAYTRPEIFKWKGKTYKVPKILLSGNHKKIAAWRQANKAS